MLFRSVARWLRSGMLALMAGDLIDEVELMSVQPASYPDPAEPYEVIHLGGEAAAIVPLAELGRLREVAVAALAAAPYPLEGFHRGRYHRLRVGRYRVMYLISPG